MLLLTFLLLPVFWTTPCSGGDSSVSVLFWSHLSGLALKTSCARGSISYRILSTVRSLIDGNLNPNFWADIALISRWVTLFARLLFFSRWSLVGFDVISGNFDSVCIFLDFWPTLSVFRLLFLLVRGWFWWTRKTGCNQLFFQIYQITVNIRFMWVDSFELAFCSNRLAVHFRFLKGLTTLLGVFLGQFTLLWQPDYISHNI